MKESAHALSMLGFALAAVGLAGCSSGGSGDSGVATGELSLAITDAPVDGVSAINVVFTGIRLKPQAGPAFDVALVDDMGEPVDERMINMLELTDGNYELLFENAVVPAGVYNWIELQVEAELDNFLTGSHVVTDNNEIRELRVPSGSQSGLRLVSPFTVTADRQTRLMIDWDMRMGLVKPTSLGGEYLLKPAFRTIDMTEHGFLAGTVADSLVFEAACANDLILDTGNAVYIYAPFDPTVDEPGDIGAAAEPTPIATATVKQQSNGQYGYKVILSPGDYMVAFTCQAGADTDEDEDIDLVLHPEPVTITDDETTVLDFS
jgi:hypothetical protein